MKYSIGLDIGITSVGWAVLNLDEGRIENLGVRLFEAAEEFRTGASLALPRREARSARRRLRRKRQRISDVKELIVSENVLSQSEMDELYSRAYITTPWELRCAGLDRPLSSVEWARVLIHIAKHRGFKSNRTTQQDDNLEARTKDGKANAAMKTNNVLLREGNGGKGYRTVGEMIQLDPKFEAHKRNKGEDYANTIMRADLTEEIDVLFAQQKGFGSDFASDTAKEKYMSIFTRQLPFALGDVIEKNTGFCSLEPKEKRAPRAAWTSERFILLSEILKLRPTIAGVRRELTLDEQGIISNLAYKNSKVTYKQIKKALNADDTWFFENVPVKKGKNPDATVFIELKAFHSFKKTISDALGSEYWDTLASTNTNILDTLAFALTFRKDDVGITEYLISQKIDEKLIKAILPLNFSGVVSLSLTAMRKLIPFMEKGQRYDEACTKAGYCHYAPVQTEQRSKKLPVPDLNDIRNPVVARAICQARKVVNAIIQKYDSPYSVQIELARDLSKSLAERREIEKEQTENRTEKNKLSCAFEESFGHVPNGRELEKYRLWKEQGGFCPYSGKYIDPSCAFMGEDGNYAEVDHIIPYSRSFDDSFINKVLVFGSENRNKRERTPYEYLGSDEEKWNEFVSRVDVYVTNRKRAERLKRKNFDDKDSSEMKERCLNDTRWITKYVADWIENSLIFSDPDNKMPVTRINGRATATLRWQWGINALKDREKSDLHHALDACVIAAATPSMIKAISDYSRKREMNLLREESPVGKKTRLPEPWPYFRKEIEARLSDCPVLKIMEFGLKNYSEDCLQAIKPIFISRKPERKLSGQAHQETIRSSKYLDTLGKTAIKTRLQSVNLKTLEDMVGKERDKALYAALKQRLVEYGNKPELAFKEEFRKPTNDGSLGPIVRSIKILTSDGISGISVRGGIASNGDMVRVDVYKKNNKHYLIPYYVYDIAKGTVKSRAITANKKESDWDIVDSSYEFLFSLYKRDLVRVVSSSKEIFGYYIGCHRGTGAINVLLHSGEEEFEGVGVKTAKLFEKYQVGILGEYHKVKKEKPPHELA